MRRFTVMALGTSALLAVLTIALVTPAFAGRNGMWGGTGDAVPIEQAREQAVEYLDDYGFDDLDIGEVMEFSNHFYAVAVDRSTGDGALELLISRDGRSVHPEPTMMWNTGYDLMHGDESMTAHRAMMADGGHGGMMSGSMQSGMMSGGMTQGMMGDGMHGGMMGNGTHGGMMADGMHGGMMGAGEHAGMMQGGMSQGMMDPGQCQDIMDTAFQSAQALDQPLGISESVTVAQAWLDTNQPGRAASEPVPFPGYVTLHIEAEGQIVGMLSVQASTGSVWEHTWHGDLLSIEHGD